MDQEGQEGAILTSLPQLLAIPDHEIPHALLTMRYDDAFWHEDLPK